MASMKLDWSSAEVNDSQLCVDLSGELNDDWKNRFEKTVALLDHGAWGAVKLKKDSIRVNDVGAGSEEKLRFFLESAVTEANTTGEEDEEAEERPDEDDESSKKENENSEDAELTERFREFASGSSESDSKSESKPD